MDKIENFKKSNLKYWKKWILFVIIIIFLLIVCGHATWHSKAQMVYSLERRRYMYDS